MFANTYGSAQKKEGKAEMTLPEASDEFGER
jgi:hypothetical protein